ncbi:hypothetical protein [Rubritalea tangerina]|uniref:hypothetical protein n=1 Tax=Rubritalea tangerina TaxID=430798 RepID=UPI00360D5EC5
MIFQKVAPSFISFQSRSGMRVWTNSFEMSESFWVVCSANQWLGGFRTQLEWGGMVRMRVFP